MALLAAIQVRSRGELASVLIFVAVHALRELDSVKSVFAFGNMALCALDRRVLLY